MTLTREDVLIEGIDTKDVPCNAEPLDGRKAVARMRYGCTRNGCKARGFVFLCGPCLHQALRGTPGDAVCPSHGRVLVRWEGLA